MVKKRFGRILFFLLGICFFFISGLLSYYEEKQEEKNIEAFLSHTSSEKVDYIAVLEIPKIKLKKGFYSYGSSKNNVNKNIEVIESSTMPDVLNGNLILASHSGTSKIAYFKNLYQLEKGDMAYVYYQNKTYTYQLLYVYNEEKDGHLSIRRSKNQTNLTLITCDKKNDSLQNVYIFMQIA